MRVLRALWSDESGATAIEYGLIAALVAVAIIGVLTTLGENLSDTFNNVAKNLASKGSGTTNSKP